MKSTTTRLLFLLGIGLLVFGSAPAGNLDPPGPPGPTMVTLQQIYDKLGGPTAVAKTGQTSCWNASGVLIDCGSTGQDGDLQKGVSVLPPRFTDNANGTVTDNLTGLIWLKNANCFGSRTWSQALSDANGLNSGVCGLTDGSVAGAWRLPNVKELQSLIDFGQYFPALPAGHPFSGVQSNRNWSSTTGANGPSNAWIVNLNAGDVYIVDKDNTGYVWPVRGGQ